MTKAKVKGYKKIRKPFFLGWGLRALFRVGLRMLIICLPLLPFMGIGAVFSAAIVASLRVVYLLADHTSIPIIGPVGIWAFTERSRSSARIALLLRL
ncbi:MAG: hypothetical protein R3B95_04870 [Nitrospirales bacterium]|nr:hypothetical protein [Nitrospirales bacterium]